MLKETRRVLIVEDDYLQAQDISRFVRGTGDEVLGPAASLESGFGFVDVADAAVLDIDIRGQNVFPLADVLLARDIPVVFYSGVARRVPLPSRFLRVPLINKPIGTFSDAAILTLSSTFLDQNDLTEILPKLRVVARLVFSDPNIADRLVERLLEDAIAHLKAGNEIPRGEGRSAWLTQRIRKVIEVSGRNLLN
jgi:hypothetical protein